jgi:quercetin dioxygenase-like cupin family protein
MDTLFLLLWVALGLGQVAQPAQPQFDAPYPLQPNERFAGPLAVRSGAGAVRTVRVAIRTWGIPNRQRVTLPERGFLTVHLVSGDATTVVGNDRRERKEGDFWTVPAGQSMVVETARDTVTISVVSIEE